MPRGASIKPRRTAQLRSAVIRAVSEQDIVAIIQKLIAEARDGDVSAAREVLTRVFGRRTDATNPVGLDEKQINDDRRLIAILDSIA